MPRRFASLLICVGLASVSCLSQPSASEATLNPIERACRLNPTLLKRIARGHHPVRSEDVTMVPAEPNYVGTFTLTSHSGPWDYIQSVPLVFYGPGFVAHEGEVKASADLADIFPTMATLLGQHVPDVDGSILKHALDPSRPASPPRLVVEIVWDGGGRGTLNQWPEAWPNLRRISQLGTSYVDAVVGSSPSITSASHSTIATGMFPRTHGITGNQLRLANGQLVPVFPASNTERLQSPTLADMIDRRYDNGSRVGLLGWVRWHAGLLGHGAGRPGGDKDQMALIHYGDGVEVHGNERLFDVPHSLASASNIKALISRVDREDGAVDGKWLGHDIRLPAGESDWLTAGNPAWAALQADVALTMLKRYKYGRDAVPDLFLTNFKMTDLAGHQWGYDSPETKAILTAQDRALGRILNYLEQEITDFVVVVTADHGAAPLAAPTGAWPISQDELIQDLEKHFGASPDKNLVAGSAAYGLYLDRDLARKLGATPMVISRWLNDYTISENWSEGDLPSGYEDRGDEEVFSAVFPSKRIIDIVGCAKERG